MVRKNTVKKSDSESEIEMIPEGVMCDDEDTSTETAGSLLQVLAGMSVVTVVLMTPFIVFEHFGMLASVLSVVVLTVKILFIENYCRRNQEMNQSLMRPSVMLTELANQSRRLFSWMGFQFARLTDICYWIYEYLAEDLFNILKPLWRLLFSWLQFFKGFVDYYLSGVTWVTLSVGVIGSLLVVVGIFYGASYYLGGEVPSIMLLLTKALNYVQQMGMKWVGKVWNT